MKTKNRSMGASMHSPSKRRGGSPSKKTRETQEGEKREGLSSPTSVSMQNSFIIKNADESFDVYYQSMKKRKHQQNQVAEHLNETKFGLVYGMRPTARDGHSANVDSQGCMYVFGGDRHHMPFNDLYMIKLQ